LNTLTQIDKSKKKKKVETAEGSIGIRLTALIMTITLLVASACYIPTDPIITLLYVGTAVLGSYLGFLFRDSRPAWLSALPTVGTLLLFTVFMLELYYGYQHSTASAVASFVHLIAGLSALHCFDLRTRGDFSIASLIGLGLLTFLMGVGRDFMFGAFILAYTVLAGLQLFFDSSSRSHELGPSRSVGANKSANQPAESDLKNLWQMVSSLEIGSLFALLPVLLLPVVSFAIFMGLPRTESLLQVFISSVRARMPLPATLTSQLGKGGRSQALRGGKEEKPGSDNSSFTVKGGNGGTAGGAGKAMVGPGGKGKSNVATQAEEGKGTDNIDLSKLEKTLTKKQFAAFKTQLAREKELNESYEKEGVDMNTPQSNSEEIVLKVSTTKKLYIRKFALNGFNGTTWKRALPTPPKTIKPNKTFGFDLTNSDAVYVPPNLPTLEVKQEFRAEADLGYMIPSSWIPQIVITEGDEVRIDSDATIKSTKRLTKGTAFTVISQAPVYDLDMMQKQPLETLSELDEDRKEELKTAQSTLDLTASISEPIKKLSLEITSDPDANWFTRALAIQSYLRKNYRYENDGLFKTLDVDKEPNQAIENFLFKTKAGSCRHFATAHALLCRSQGIPVRLVMGYLPGTFNKETGYNEIRRKDSHVWTEVYIPYWNWVPFDPTPSGELPAHEEGGNALTKFIRSGLANPFAQEIKSNHKNPRPLAGLESLGGNQEQNPTPPPPPGKKTDELKLPGLGSIDPQIMQIVVKILGLLVSLGLLGLAIVVYLNMRKKAKVRELLAIHKPSTLVYLEVLEELKRYEVVKFPTETVDEVSLRFQEKWQEMSNSGNPVDEELAPVVSSFMELYTADRFGGEDNLDELTEISRKIKSLTGSSQRR